MVGFPRYVDFYLHNIYGSIQRWYRSLYVDAAVRKMDPKHTHCNKHCTSISASDTQPSRSTLHFADGTTAEADIVLLADGYRGAMRNIVTGAHPTNHVSFSNTICYRGLIPMEEARAAGVTTNFKAERLIAYLGKDKVGLQILQVAIETHRESISIAIAIARLAGPDPGYPRHFTTTQFLRTERRLNALSDTRF